MTISFGLLREARKRNANRQNKSSPAANEEKRGTRNYGTCTDKFFSNYDLSNGHVKSKSFCSRDSTNSSKKTKRVKKTSKCSDNEAKLVEEVLANRTLPEGEVSPRPYQNIFICDHSQLPKEEVDDEFELEIKRTKRQKLQVRSPRSPFSSDDDAMAGGFQGFYFPERPATESAEKRNSVMDIPSVVLNDEQTRANSPSNVGRHSERNLSVEKGDNLWCVISGDHPFERPLSRRGSVNEAEQEEGEEGTYNEGTREDTPDPLGDEQQQNAPKEKPLIIVLKRNRERKGKIVSNESESDNEEEEEEEDALYQPLKEEGWRKNSDRVPKGEAESSSEAEESAGAEKAVLDRHNYERLMESPGALTDPPKAEPLINVIEEFAERTNIDPKRVNLYTKQYKRCDPKDTPLALGLSDNCTAIELDAFEDLEQSEEDKGVKLKYQMKGRRPVTVCALPNATFALLKELFCTDHGLEPAKTRFILDSDLIDHYGTLGVERSASPKNIKAAFFELTKKHHPDMNPEDKVKAAEAFQNITEAYEVLGSEEKRQIYDALTAKRPHLPVGMRKSQANYSGRHAGFGTTENQKDWTDLDIDFKDFEHFQHENRRRRMFHDWRQADTTSDYFWYSHQTSKMYKDPRVLEREVLEKRLHAELTERRKRDKMPIPTFEQLYRLEILEKQKRT
uniref:J domain-containing protein n=1 Tax=Globodera pallida TaxID=36090 RepID=A0A183CD90_GLOPA